MGPKRLGILCVVSGPSGSGKTTLCRRMAAELEDCVYSISCTTRPPREGEKDGEDYFFLSQERFEQKIAEGELLEYAQVHGRYYGTLKGPILDHLKQGRDVFMDLDVQGADQLRSNRDPVLKNALVDVFILPPSLEELAARVQARAPMSDSELELRMKNAQEEMQHWRKYRYAIITGEREEDFANFQSIIQGERHRASRLTL